MTQYWSEFIQRFLRIVIFMFLLPSVTAADGHLGLPNHINLKGPYLYIILIECTVTKFCSVFHEILTFWAK